MTAISTAKEYITLEEAVHLTGFKDIQLKRLLKQAGVVRFGASSWDREEFFRFLRFKNQAESDRGIRETPRQRRLRILRNWKL